MIRTLNVELVSNGYKLAMTPERLGWLEPSDPSRPLSQLWDQFQEEGYLYLKGILDRASVLEFRERFFCALLDTGLLADGSQPVDGIYSGRKEEGGLARQKLTEIARWAYYEAFCLSAPIREFYERVLGGPVYLHKRKLIRYNLPDEPGCTGAHYDLVYLRAGTTQVYTSWIPLGDTPAEMGGLVYLEGSHRWGKEKEAEFSVLNADLPEAERISAYNKNMGETGWLTKDIPSLADRLGTRWLMADYEAGDMVVHSPFTIHASTVNVDTDRRIRLSTDIRYQLASDSIDPRWKNDWHPGDNV